MAWPITLAGSYRAPWPLTLTHTTPSPPPSPSPSPLPSLLNTWDHPHPHPRPHPHPHPHPHPAHTRLHPPAEPHARAPRQVRPPLHLFRSSDARDEEVRRRHDGEVEPEVALDQDEQKLGRPVESRGLHPDVAQEDVNENWQPRGVGVVAVVCVLVQREDRVV